MKKIIVAIDGYSSSGKSTMARRLARETGYVYVDSGAMYRAVTLYALRNGMVSPDGVIDVCALVRALPGIEVAFQPAGADGIQHTLLNGEDVESEIRTLRVGSHVSPVAEIPEVRSRLTELQRAMGDRKGIVMDGRDIGTTVFPDAEMKVFVNASPECRAQRRFKELQEAGKPGSYDDVLKNIMERDHIDTTREVSPLRRADDAVSLDNGNMSIEEQSEWMLSLFRERTAEI